MPGDTSVAHNPDASDGRAGSASYLSADTILLTGYHESLEVMRHITMRTVHHETKLPVMGGTLNTLHANAHVFRRRLMNHIVRPDALERYREEVTLPTLSNSLSRLAAMPQSDGTYRTDLVSFSKHTFLQFAAILMGLDATTEEAAAALENFLIPIERLEHVMFTPDDSEMYRPRAVAAATDLRSRFVEPAIAKCPAHLNPERNSESPNLIELLASKADPAWSDLDLATRELIATLLGAVDTSANLITNAVEDLLAWFDRNPQEASLSLDIEFLGRVIQEAVRLHPALPHFVREATEDVVLSTSGRAIKKGQLIAVEMQAASTDSDVFGRDAAEFNPHRHLAGAVPRYGLNFGAGQHQCIGLRVVLGNAGIGSHAHVLKMFLAAGIQRDSKRAPELEPGNRGVFRVYPVMFTNLSPYRRSHYQ